MKKRKIQIEIIQQGEPRRKEILDFWEVQIGEQLKKEVPSKEERIEILEQILKKFYALLSKNLIFTEKEIPHSTPEAGP